ncbi:exported hypothetical protein [Vibrio crassostreae]|uniref:Uncharacterized protein n=1 Tax=Vibrio crassostreae TaxID=246167 RepID=A0A822MS40_9VIBR|nr:exported hypothetical protein [Vibrio crassostreae]CAK1724183.1 exported hypothetical protein [Vibrio crassostreae]CAK1724842.1 exported hypothetical protein [Vibrio crassostreae]CAK1725520.1 exported hypothetical protein [Vibrio crassostreae]CAK1726362.1 exported hypothetical protein [Vibrio crassostreae]
MKLAQFATSTKLRIAVNLSITLSLSCLAANRILLDQYIDTIYIIFRYLSQPSELLDCNGCRENDSIN